MEKNKFEILKELLITDRSYRRFEENHRVDRQLLIRLVELTRYCASGRNLQPMKYYIVNETDTCDKIFTLLKWAGYLTDWDGPEKGERPSAYIIQCLDKSLTRNYLCDDGIQLQTITLGATAEGLGCCIIKSFNVEKLKEFLGLGDTFDPLYVVAIGKPIEKVVIEDMDKKDKTDIKYYRTPDRIHHVPKRILEELIINK